MSAIIRTRPEFLYELKIICETHKISTELAIKALALLYNISWEITAEDTVALYSAGLLKTNSKKINVKKLFKGIKGKESDQLKLGFSTDPLGTEKTLKLADNLMNNFVPDENITDTKIKEVADNYFYGDTGVAKYFIIFEHLFPKKSLRHNKKWNKHFGITFTDSTKWALTGGVPAKFHKLYLTKDIGLVLSGLYYYMKDSINLENFVVYCSTPNTFLTNHEQWYDHAKSEIEERQKLTEISKEVL